MNNIAETVILVTIIFMTATASVFITALIINKIIDLIEYIQRR
mgnify:CR=1 FL=1